ncbi:MAG TPA: 30S ribosomal protein S8e [Candidatus Nanoarchaeia archaeon]|nr:30S ribosomal protein S8e [Candidatus Nanoarchaeia archaeon]
MVTRKGRKKTGGKYIKSRKKKKNEMPGQKRIVKLAEDNKRKTKRTLGGNTKTFLLKGAYINVHQKGKKSKAQKSKIKNVLETPSNKFLARQNILTKGTIVETELGKVKVTNRPSQDGVINGILIE